MGRAAAEPGERLDAEADAAGEAGGRPLLTGAAATGAPRRPPVMRQPSAAAVLVALVATAFWLGASIAFALGYFGPDGLLALKLHWQAAVAAAILVPVIMIWLAAILARRAEAMRLTAEDLAVIAWRLTLPEEAAGREVARLGRIVRQELDAMQAGVEATLSGVRALDHVLGDRATAVERIAGDVNARVDAIRASLRDERDRLADLVRELDGHVDSLGERLSARVGLAKQAVDAAAAQFAEAEGALEARLESFRGAAESAAGGTRAAGKEIERESARFEAAAEAALARAEALQQRHEKQRAMLMEAVERLRAESETVEAAMTAQRENLEKLTRGLGSEAERIEAVAADGARRIEVLSGSLAARLDQLGEALERESGRTRAAGEQASAAIEATNRAVLDIAERARATLQGEAKDATRTVEEIAERSATAMARLSELLAGMKTASSGAVAALDEAASRVNTLVTGLPSQAGEMAARLRAQLDAEALAQSRFTAKPREVRIAAGERQPFASPHPAPARPVPVATPDAEPDFDEIEEPGTAAAEPGDPDLVAEGRTPVSEDTRRGRDQGGAGWLEFARRLAGRERKDELGPAPWRLSTVLKAADRAHAEAPAADRARLQAMSLKVIETLESLAIDLDRALEDEPPLDLWRRYLGGERSVFARRLVALLGRDHQERITEKYRADEEFRDYVDRYVRQFESLLQESQGAEPKLSETYLTSQTGKVYLILANAIGRLSPPLPKAQGD